MNKLLFLLIIFSGSALSCEGDYFYGRVGYGIMTNNLDHDRKHPYNFDAATLDLGYSLEITEEWHFDLRYQHISRWFTGSPFNHNHELTSEQMTFGLGYRYYLYD